MSESARVSGTVSEWVLIHIYIDFNLLEMILSCTCMYVHVRVWKYLRVFKYVMYEYEYVCIHIYEAHIYESAFQGILRVYVRMRVI